MNTIHTNQSNQSNNQLVIAVPRNVCVYALTNTQRTRRMPWLKEEKDEKKDEEKTTTRNRYKYSIIHNIYCICIQGRPEKKITTMSRSNEMKEKCRNVEQTISHFFQSHKTFRYTTYRNLNSPELIHTE